MDKIDYKKELKHLYQPSAKAIALYAREFLELL